MIGCFKIPEKLNSAYNLTLTAENITSTRSTAEFILECFFLRNNLLFDIFRIAVSVTFDIFN